MSQFPNGATIDSDITFDERSTPSLITIVLRRKWIIAVAGLIGASLGYLYYSKTDPIFESRAQVMVTRVNPIPIAANTGAGHDNWSAHRNNLNNQISLIRSRHVVRVAMGAPSKSRQDDSIQSLVNQIEDVTGRDLTVGEEGDQETINSEISKLTSLRDVEDPVAIVVGNVDAEQQKESEVLLLKYRCGVREDCQPILDAIVKGYQLYLEGERHSITREALRLITRAKIELEKDLERHEKAYLEFRQKNDQLLYKAAEGQNIYQGRQKDIERERNELKNQRTKIKAELDSRRKALASGVNPDALLLLIKQSLNSTKVIIDEPTQKKQALERRLRQTKDEMLEVGNQLAQLRVKQADVDEKLRRLEEVERKLRRFAADIRQVEASIAFTEKKIASSNFSLQGLDIESQLKRGLVDLTVKEQTLRDKHGAGHPSVIELQKEIATRREVLRETLNKELAKRRTEITREIAGFEEEKMNLAEELLLAKQDNNDLKAEYDELQMQRPGLDSERAKLQAEYRLLEENQFKLVKDRSDYRAQREALEKVPEKARDPMKDEVESAKQQVAVYLESLAQEIGAIDLKIRGFDELFKEAETNAKSLQHLESQDRGFQASQARKEQLYEAVTKSLEKISLTDDMGGYDALEIRPAAIGVQVEPSLSRVLMLSCFLGLCAGISLAYVVDIADQRFRSPDDIRGDLGLKLLGHVPMLPRRKESNGLLDPSIITVHKPRSVAAESYRAVRTALYFNEGQEKLKVVQVTSPSPGDGKSTLAANLAVTIAQSGKKVMLVDCDFRKPRIHRLFGVNQQPGLHDVVDERCDFKSAVQTCGVENLFLLTCGRTPHNPSELLSSRRFKKLLDELRNRVHYIILDTPPLLAVSDPCNVAPRADGVLVVLRITKHARMRAIRATELLSDLDANPIGVVVNAIGGRRRWGYGDGYNVVYRGYRYGGYGQGYGNGDSVYGDDSIERVPSCSES